MKAYNLKILTVPLVSCSKLIMQSIEAESCLKGSLRPLAGQSGIG